MLRVATTNDTDFAPLFFPLTAGWAEVPQGIQLVPGTLNDGLEGLMQGTLDVAMVSPLIYATNQDQLLLVPTPVLAPDIATDSVFLISSKRLDKFERPRVACSPTSATAAAILRVLAGSYYGFTPEIFPVDSDTAALRALQGVVDICVVSGEVGMRAAGPANEKGYFVEDLTKAWWIMTGQPLPIGLFAVRREWTKSEPEANALIRSMMIMFRVAVQKSKEQVGTIVEKEERRTGLAAKALIDHYYRQRYELNEAHLRALLEFFRRIANERLAPLITTFEFFPSSLQAEPAPASPPRRTMTEPARPPKPNPRERAEERGLRVIKGGKGKDRDKEDAPSNEHEDAPVKENED
jgi:predicted solute-binding protein